MNEALCESLSPPLFASLPVCCLLCCWVWLDAKSSAGGILPLQRLSLREPMRCRGSIVGSRQNPFTCKQKFSSQKNISSRKRSTRVSAKCRHTANRSEERRVGKEC